MTTVRLLALVTLPAGLGDQTLANLAQLWDYWSPRDAYERFLVTRLIQAAARLELSAAREPESPDALWLRYETAADRLFRQSLSALLKHRAQNPLEAKPAPPSTPVPAPPQPPRSNPSTPLPADPPPTPALSTSRSTPPPNRLNSDALPEDAALPAQPVHPARIVADLARLRAAAPPCAPTTLAPAAPGSSPPGPPTPVDPRSRPVPPSLPPRRPDSVSCISNVRT
ncbi:MAG: hypothetical protein KatS3mg108_2802 [Isosphaeraceae bacterium]|jgi:hypothetical protein|nr:MAG: hypothetical protein KatS3mg108_2802 [Isosphaeraceae bacterium]